MRSQSILLGAVVAGSLFSALVAVTAAPAQAQASLPPASKRVTLTGQGLDVREALRALFKQSGTTYTIAPEVQGTVAADFRDLGIEDALRLVLREVDATWRTEGGVFQILSRETAAGRLPPGISFVSPDPVFNTIVAASPAVEPPVVASDAAFLYVVRQGVVHKIDKATMQEVGKTDLNLRKVKITY